MRTPDLVDENIEKIGKLFPECLTERKGTDGTPELAIDIDKLSQLLARVVNGTDERYQLTWPGKNQSVFTANTPINKTLRPCREKSEDFDNTENIYIEGENLDVLKLLREDYLGKVKMIYIDPPYNTGSDFIFNDYFAQSPDKYSKNSNQKDDYDNCLLSNPESNGRFHTDWLNMIYPRLKLARDFLSDDGVIFISIDDNELQNLRSCCSEIFGNANYIATFIIASNSSKNNSKFVSVTHEYVLCYCKSFINLNDQWRVKKNNADEYLKRARAIFKMDISDEDKHQELLSLVKYPRFYDFDHYTYVDAKGVYQTNDPGGVPNGNFSTEIMHPVTGKPCAKPRGGWRYKDEEIKRKLANDEFAFGEDETVIPRPKRYIDDFLYQVPRSILFVDSQSTTHWLKDNNLPFDFPKPVELVEYFISIMPKDAIVMDFFAGSSTTAHAVMHMNAKDNGSRKFILIQLPEHVREDSDAYKAGFKTICELGEERIRIASKNILKEQEANRSVNLEHTKTPKLDVGFRVLKLDSSNMKDVYYKPSDVTNDLFSKTEDNIKEERTDEDLLFQVMLEMAVPLSAKIHSEEICGKKVLTVDDNYLIACFDKDITDEVITDIAKRKPQYFVMRDSSAHDDSVITNFETIFQTYSKDTVRKIL